MKKVKKTSQPVEDAISILYGEQAYKTFEIFYRFKTANLANEFKKAIDLYDQNPKVIKSLFQHWNNFAAQELNEDDPEDSYKENEHRFINEDYATAIDSENPHAWEFIEFSNQDAISQNIKKFKNAILRYANKKGLNQKKLAETIGVSNQAISQFFNSETMPRPSTLIKISEALQVHGVYIHHPEMEGEAKDS